MAINLIFYDLVRRTPSKILIVFFTFIIVGKFIPKYKILKANKDYKFKEVEERRKLAMKLILLSSKE